MTPDDVIPCPDCGHALHQDGRGVYCDGCGVRLWFTTKDGPASPDVLREAVTGLLWGARVKPSKPARKKP